MILVDDGSPDNCPQICDEYSTKDCRIKVIHKNNGGVSSARNAGIEVATGYYLTFLDSDDWIREGYVTKMVSEIEQQDADLIVAGYEAIFDNDGIDPIMGKFDFTIYKDVQAFASDFHKYFGTIFNFAWGKLYKSEIVKEHALRFKEDIVLGEDLIFNIGYYELCHKIIIQGECLVVYRQISNSLSRKHYDSVFEYRDIYYSTINEFLNKHDVYTSQNKKIMYCTCFANYMYALQGLVNDAAIGFNQKISDSKKAMSIYWVVDSYPYYETSNIFLRVSAHLINLKAMLPFYLFTKIYKNAVSIRNYLFRR